MLRLYIKGVEFRLSLLFPAALAVLFTVDRSGFPAWCVAASVMHEAGHFFALFALGSRPAKVNIGIFGVCVIQSPHCLLAPWRNLLVALAGPFVNIITFSVVFPVCGFCIPTLVHLIIGVFNLLPIEPLDGGQALYYALLQKMEEVRAERIVFAVSVAVLIPIATGGFYLLIRSGYNFTLLAVSIYLGLLLLLKRKR